MRSYFYFLFLVLYLIFFSIFSACSSIVFSRQEITFDKGQVLTGVHTWRGRVRINGKLALDRNCELTIMPGTVVVFGKGGGISGTQAVFVARGTLEKPVVFTGLEKKAASWGEIQISHSPKVVIEKCVFEYAEWGLHLHFSNVSIRQCYFRNNYGGIRFRSGPIYIKHNIFSNNHFALRLNNSSPAILENVFKNNSTAIFFRDGIRKIDIKNNNFLETRGYNIQLGEEQKDAILIKYNWWNTTDIDVIRKFIFDKYYSDYLGEVTFIPFLKKPVPIVLPVLKGTSLKVGGKAGKQAILARHRRENGSK